MDSAEAAPATATTSEGVERDHLVFALLYGQRYGHRLCRLYSRLAGLLRFGEVIAGSTAFAAYFAGSPAFSGYSGLALAIISGINIAFDPAAKARDASFSQGEFGQALIGVEKITTSTLRQRVRELQAQPRAEIESLRTPVWRDVVRQLGRPVPAGWMTPGEYVLDALA